MFRGLEALLASVGLTLSITALAAYHHPSWQFICWLILDIAVAVMRVPLVVYLMRAGRRGGRRPIPPWSVDLFVWLGTIWSATVGFGVMLCLAVSDPGLSILAALLAMGTVGAQCARNPGAPRLNVLQMGLITMPFSIGAAFNTVPFAHFAAGMAPLYLFSMITITRALHADYVNLIVTRLDNRRRARHCPLTDLPNRTAFSERLTWILAEADPRRRPVVMYLDLDGFKAVNDVHGHPVGDLLLAQVALRLIACAPPQALVSRLGGDEFALLVDDADAAVAEETACAILSALGQPFDLGEACTVSIGVSIGIARCQPGATPHGVVRRADAALYEAKRAGRGVFRWEGEGVPDSDADIAQLHDAALFMRRAEMPAQVAALA